MKRHITADEIASVLPQAPPILMVDAIDVHDDDHLTATKAITDDYWALTRKNGRFPGIFFVEIAMQALTCELLMRDELKGKLVIFSGIKSAEFIGQPKAGDEIISDVEVETLLGDKGGVFKFMSRVGETEVANGHVRIAIVDPDAIVDGPSFEVQDLSALGGDSVPWDRLAPRLDSDLQELLIDRLSYDAEAQTVRAMSVVSGESMIMEGHFKDVRIMNGLFLLQMAEQMVNLLPDAGPRRRLAKISKIQFKKINHPGDVVLLEVTLDDPAKPARCSLKVHSENVLSGKGVLEFADAL